MNFKSVAEAFNYYKDYDLQDIEKRAAEINGIIDTDPEADITKLNIEIEGLKQAKENIKEKEDDNKEQRNFNPITGMNFNSQNRIPEENIFETREYRNAFYKNLLGQKMTDVESRAFKKAMEVIDKERRADAFNTTTNSPAVLPTTTLNEVIKKARTMGGLIAHCRNFNIPSNLSVPIGTPASKAQWHTEGQSVESEKVDTVNVEFAGYEILKVFSISAAAKKMSIPAFESYLIDELNNTVVECIADSLVNGTGDKQGTGLLPGITWDSTNSLTFAKTGTPKYTDFTKMMAMLKRGYGANAKWAMNNATLYNHVYSIVDNNERPIFITDPKNEAIGYILGKEVVIDDNIEDDTILLGDFDYMGYNIPEGIMIEVSRESSFRSGLIDYRALAIADTKPLVDEAFIKLTRDTTTA